MASSVQFTGCIPVQAHSFVSALSFFCASISYGNVTINFDIGQLRDAEGAPLASQCMWALLVAPSGSSLPGSLEQNSSLSGEDMPEVRADFGGSHIFPGSKIEDSLVIATGLLDIYNFMISSINWTDEDYATLEAGGLIGLYWFPEINSESDILPDSDFQIGGFQESEPDLESNGNAGMIVPANSGQLLNIFFYDATVSGSTSSLPPSRFTAIEVPPSGYQVWRDGTFSPLQIEAGDALPAADPDGDGLANLVEYATGSAPLQLNPGPLGLTASGESLLLEFPRIADPELRYRIEATADLSLSVWPDLVFESTGSENLEELVQLSQPLSPGQRFFRLRVE